MKILVLLSGGLDSAVVLASLLKQHHACSAIGFDYDQKHRIELEYAAKLASHYRVPFDVRELPAMPLVNNVVFAGRNLLMAATAIAEAQAQHFDAIAVGSNQSDWQEFPDCRPAFWSAVKAAADAYNVLVLAPLLYAWKAVIVNHAREMGVPIDLTWSCYSPENKMPCGRCLACLTRQEALKCF